MNRILLALLLAASCKHSSSASSTSHTETSTVTDSTSSESGATTTVTTQTEGPGETTTTVEEYAPPVEEAEPSVGVDSDGGVDNSRAAANVTSAGRHSNPPILVKRTVTITKSGGETTQTRQETRDEVQRTVEVREQAEADAKAQAQTASAPAASCVSLGWLWGLAVLVGVVGIVYGVVKMRRAIP